MTPARRIASSLEDLAAELGLGRAVEILEGERVRARGMIGAVIGA
jgi:hypothetical protein